MSAYGKIHVFFFQFRFQNAIFFLIGLFLMAEPMCTLPSPVKNARTANSKAIMWPTRRSSKKIHSAHQYLLAISTPGLSQGITVVSPLSWHFRQKSLFPIQSVSSYLDSMLAGRSLARKPNSVKTLQISDTILSVCILTVSATISLNVKHLRLWVATDTSVTSILLWKRP